jgi:hypothetical protein
MYFAVRTKYEPETSIPSLRTAIHRLDPELPVDAIGTVDALIVTSLSERRFAMLLTGARARIGASDGGDLWRDLLRRHAADAAGTKSLSFEGFKSSIISRMYFFKSDLRVFFPNYSHGAR